MLVYMHYSRILTGITCSLTAFITLSTVADLWPWSEVMMTTWNVICSSMLEMELFQCGFSDAIRKQILQTTFVLSIILKQRSFYWDRICPWSSSDQDKWLTERICSNLHHGQEKCWLHSSTREAFIHISRLLLWKQAVLHYNKVIYYYSMWINYTFAERCRIPRAWCKTAFYTLVKI